MTSQGSPRSRFARAIKMRSAFLAEVALREMGNPTLLEALDYLDLLVTVSWLPLAPRSDRATLSAGWPTAGASPLSRCRRKHAHAPASIFFSRPAVRRQGPARQSVP
jgi:hypothetical protein